MPSRCHQRKRPVMQVTLSPTSVAAAQVFTLLLHAPCLINCEPASPSRQVIDVMVLCHWQLWTGIPSYLVVRVGLLHGSRHGTSRRRERSPEPRYLTPSRCAFCCTSSYLYVFFLCRVMQGQRQFTTFVEASLRSATPSYPLRAFVAREGRTVIKDWTCTYEHF